jgi:hypothetical protein
VTLLGRALVVGGTAEKVFVQMRHHLEQVKYDVEEIMCQQYLLLGSLSIHQQVWGSIHSMGIYPFKKDAFVKTYPFKKDTLSGSLFLTHREVSFLLHA